MRFQLDSEMGHHKGVKLSGLGRAAHGRRIPYVGTDNWPVEFRYISSRLAREIVEQHEAANPRRTVSSSLNLKIATVELARRGPDYANRFDLARRATDAIVDSTGTIAWPGEYVRGEEELVPCAVRVHLGWRRGVNREIAAFFADWDSEDSGRTFLALFGSIGNFVGHKPQESGSGWFPSDMAGLYVLLNSVLEPSDPQLSAAFVRDDRDLNDAARCSAAWMMSHHVATRFAKERLAFLARCYYQCHGVSVAGSAYDSVLVGAPIWVATPTLRALETL